MQDKGILPIDDDQSYQHKLPEPDAEAVYEGNAPPILWKKYRAIRMWQKMPTAAVKKEEENKAYWMFKVLPLIILALILLSILMLIVGPMLVLVALIILVIGYVVYKKVSKSKEAKDDNYQKVESIKDATNMV